ncbi:ABC transporter ATP-binding protein [Sulfitobacter sp. M57]|uniref:ABC transporter ATP-binding protein n=1 Tax=unclassified Sulfitobacter TaxID=196795 RepID=UPI0023E0AE5D|nr:MULTISPECIES: ABC transporter ATP-binding protein [unclassified Sulfitobacter]MDF3416081.1 ABC transporter ATP-binding protein [Sulfitobacter sp. KE5]MDF3423560.1 ABC transporter ATP-binding protein [Sulfitobacter sp. KE43]MDF3434638.1 ABC transporter ATP-binding protein [Sulfitobacter sp. KE42]MDF3460266.1 ABC transporter ATP-binding protein [Sulfitobacter sp. S74]MDF3464176.1 ABC transporter ATP-binding protein [Sulfitobacter sp. Ks18]
MTESTSSIAQKPWADPNAEPFMQIKNVTKKFGSFTAVENVSLDIYKGEIFCLLGGSGCGKSTLLRMLSGFETPTSGQIIIDGQDQAGVAAYDRETNMMFQSYALFPHMSVEKNIAYGLKRAGLPKAEIATRVTDILSLVQMDSFAKRKPHQLSGGQRQRVALARALVKKPKLLMLDEPLGALDKKLREETQSELIKIQESLGVTFVVVTHDQEEAMTLSSRIGVMTEGEIVQVGTPHEIYEYPQNRFVADFVGSVNVFEGRIKEDGEDHVIVESRDTGSDIYVPHGISGVEGQKVAIAVRPEKIEIGKTELENVRNSISGTVDEISYMGNVTVYKVVLDSGKRVRVSRSNRIRSTEDALAWGDVVHLGWAGTAGVVVTS